MVTLVVASPPKINGKYMRPCVSDVHAGVLLYWYIPSSCSTCTYMIRLFNPRARGNQSPVVAKCMVLFTNITHV